MRHENTFRRAAVNRKCQDDHQNGVGPGASLVSPELAYEQSKITKMVTKVEVLFPFFLAGAGGMRRGQATKARMCGITFFGCDPQIYIFLPYSFFMTDSADGIGLFHCDGHTCIFVLYSILLPTPFAAFAPLHLGL